MCDLVVSCGYVMRLTVMICDDDVGYDVRIDVILGAIKIIYFFALTLRAIV